MTDFITLPAFEVSRDDLDPLIDALEAIEDPPEAILRIRLGAMLARRNIDTEIANVATGAAANLTPQDFIDSLPYSEPAPRADVPTVVPPITRPNWRDEDLPAPNGRVQRAYRDRIRPIYTDDQ